MRRKNMKKKNWTGIIFAAAVTAAGLTGCGNIPQAEAAAGERTENVAEGVAGTETPVSEKQPETVSDDSFARVREAGVLKVGTEGTYAPYSYHAEDGSLTGFDVEVAELVARKLGVKAEFVETKWDAMIAGLDAGRFDIIANQVGISEERLEKYDFSEPYTYIHGALIVHRDNEDITSFGDIAGKKSAQTLTSNWGQTAEEYGAQLVGVDGFEQSIELIASGRADLTINSEVALYDYLKQKPDAPIKKVALSGDPSVVGIPVRKGETSLYEAVNRAVLELKEEGTLTELSLKYFGVDITQE